MKRLFYRVLKILGSILEFFILLTISNHHKPIDFKDKIAQLNTNFILRHSNHVVLGHYSPTDEEKSITNLKQIQN